MIPDDRRVIDLTVGELRQVLAEGHQQAPAHELAALQELAEGGPSVRALRAAIARGELPAVKLGRGLYVRRSDHAAWLVARQVKPKARATRKASVAEQAIEAARRSGALRVVGGGQ